MIPLEKVSALVDKHDSLEKELSTGTIDPKTFAQKSKEYSDLGRIILYAREYLKFNNDIKDSEQILQDKSSDVEMKNLAEKELDTLKKKQIDYTNKLKIFLLPKDTKLAHYFDHNPSEGTLDIILKSSKNTFLKSAILMNDQIFP